MQRSPFEVLEISQSASQNEIYEAYKSLRTKYSEERFLEGDAGANAAKKLSEIETAYAEAIEINKANVNINVNGSKYFEINELVKGKKYAEAQSALDDIAERDAEWHYLQGCVFYNKGWLIESKTQLEIAIKLEPNNAKYTDNLNKLNDKLSGKSNFNQVNQDQARRAGYGKSAPGTPGGNCTCCDFCAGFLCADMCCNCMGGCC